jgi:short-subunit dehydrogenase
MTAFANRVVLITGAGSGLGRQLALTLAAEAAAIGSIDLAMEPLAKLAVELPHERSARAVADVTDRTALRQAVAQIRQQLGPIDIVIANAGIGMETSALEFRSEDIETQVRVNLIGVANTFETVLPDMLERKRGHLVAISSLASFRGCPGLAGYCASKAGVNGMLDAIRAEVEPLGISVTTICPGWVRTPLTADLEVPPDMLEVDDAARRIVNAIHRGKRFYAFPWWSALQVRILGWLPCGLSDWLMRRLLTRPTKKGTTPATGLLESRLPRNLQDLDGRF